MSGIARDAVTMPGRVDTLATWTVAPSSTARSNSGSDAKDRSTSGWTGPVEPQDLDQAERHLLEGLRKGRPGAADPHIRLVLQELEPSARVRRRAAHRPLARGRK